MRTSPGFACVAPREPKWYASVVERPSAGDRIQQRSADLPKRALAYTAQKDKVEEVDVAVKIDGLRGDRGIRMDRGSCLEYSTSGRQHTAPIASGGRKAS